MQPDNNRDTAYLWDMLEHSRLILGLIEGASFQDYENNKKTQLAVERALEIIGVAAGKVSEAFRNSHDDIPWRGIIAQRNVLAHEYGDIKSERIWIVATERIPELIKELEKIDFPAAN